MYIFIVVNPERTGGDQNSGTYQNSTLKKVWNFEKNVTKLIFQFIYLKTLSREMNNTDKMGSKNFGQIKKFKKLAKKYRKDNVSFLV